MKQENPVTGSKLSIIQFYRKQLIKFHNLGLGKETENRVLITENLINMTKMRLAQLSVSYEASLSVENKYNRRMQRKLNKAKLPPL